MHLFNKTRNVVLAQDIVMAKSLISRTRGLLGKKGLPPGQVMILSPCNSVHTFFMRFAIDLIFIDKDYKVVKTLSKLAPNRITPIYWKASKVIELAAGTLSSSNIQPLDQLEISD